MVPLSSFTRSNRDDKFEFEREISRPSSNPQKESFRSVKKRDNTCSCRFPRDAKSTWNRLGEFKGGEESFHKTPRNATTRIAPFSNSCRSDVIRCQTSPPVSLVRLIKFPKDKKRERHGEKKYDSIVGQFEIFKCLTNSIGACSFERKG